MAMRSENSVSIQVAILHRPVRHVAQLRRPPLGLLVQAGLRGGGRFMGLRFCAFTLEVRLRVAVRAAAVLALEALV